MLTGKVVVVTGGAGRLGRTFCSAISARGGIPVVTDLDEAAAREIASAIRAEGGSSDSAGLDITDQAGIDALIADLRARHGRLDAVVNNAYPRNANYGRRLEEVAYRDFCENLDAHLGGYFLVAQRFALDFRAHGGGNIVNLSSIYGVVAPRFGVYADSPMTMPVDYAAIKAGVNHLTRYFAQYFKRDGVRCNALAPGGIRAGQPESFLGRYDAACGLRGMLEPGDVAGTLCFLLSEDSRHMTGQVLVVDDGFTL